MKTNSKTVPELRFKGFSSEFETNELGKITRVVDCKHRTPEYVEIGIPIVSPGSIRWGEIDLNSPKKRVTESDYESLMDHCKPNIGDLVLSRNQSLGVASHVNTKQKFVLGQDTVLIQQKNGNGKLIFYRLQTSETQNLINRLSGGSTFSRINLKDIRELHLSLPSHQDEQQKIASFLTAVDQRIDQLRRKKALLEDYKKGVMQQLFSQTLRFKDDDGNEFPDWEEKKLGEVADQSKRWSFTGGPFGSNLKSEDYTESGIRIIQLQNIGDGEFHNRYKIYTSEQKADELRSCNIFPKDLILSKMGDPVARACIVPEFEARYVMCSDGIRLAVNQSRFDKYFVFCQINHRSFRNSAITAGTGSTRKRIGLTELRTLPFAVPILLEQKKIGNFLSAIDRKIESVAKQIDHTQTFKKGLLQQMFV